MGMPDFSFAILIFAVVALGTLAWQIMKLAARAVFQISIYRRLQREGAHTEKIAQARQDLFKIKTAACNVGFGVFFLLGLSGFLGGLTMLGLTVYPIIFGNATLSENYSEIAVWGGLALVGITSFLPAIYCLGWLFANGDW